MQMVFQIHFTFQYGSSSPVQPHQRCAAQKNRPPQQVNTLSNYFSVPAQNNTAQTCSSKEDKQATQKPLSNVTDSLIAEIRWALKIVVSHYSVNSVNGTGKLFGKMFWDSNIAKNFSIESNKLAYIINFGLAPHFQNVLFENVKKSNIYSLSFDESYNHVLQQGQMDIIVRFYDCKQKSVVTQYLTSTIY